MILTYDSCITTVTVSTCSLLVLVLVSKVVVPRILVLVYNTRM